MYIGSGISIFFGISDQDWRNNMGSGIIVFGGSGIGVLALRWEAQPHEVLVDQELESNEFVGSGIKFFVKRTGITRKKINDVTTLFNLPIPPSFWMVHWWNIHTLVIPYIFYFSNANTNVCTTDSYTCWQ